MFDQIYIASDILTDDKNIHFKACLTSLICNPFGKDKKALFALKIFKFCLCFFGHVEKWLDEKAKLNFKIYDAIYLETNNYNTRITKYLEK